jgi:UDP-GlcNAc3NAcA epimerase
LRKRIVTIVGARPQFIKSLPLSIALSKIDIKEVMVHTGQHYDYEMSEVFFKSLKLRRPDYHLEVGSLSHGAQTGRMLEEIEKVLLKEMPNAVIVYGDTNSTLAGALAATKLHIPLIHIEAGLRSFNRNMPEEINRVVTDHLSFLLFAPTKTAVENLRDEGITGGVCKTGDIMLDTSMMFRKRFSKLAKSILTEFGMIAGTYGLVTVHREENTSIEARWKGIISGLQKTARGGLPLIWPIHPRIKDKVKNIGMNNLKLLGPLPYMEMQALLSQAKVVLTDSGGLQKEAFFCGVPCLTLRDETEWVELVNEGVNIIVGTDPNKIAKSALNLIIEKNNFKKRIYGNGKASEQMASVIGNSIS